MSRIYKAYQARFRTLLQRARARRVDQGVLWLTSKAHQVSAQQGCSEADALTRVYERLAGQPFFQKANLASLIRTPSRFFCDAGLGGLARWLRAAGFEALWRADIGDTQLLSQARQCTAAVLTTDSMMMERRILRDRLLPSLWLPPTLRVPEQLALVFREFGLRLQAPRCMACGGQLRQADKDSLRDRIPPRTFRWRDEYFLCTACNHLFWHGTHWQRIQNELTRLGQKPPTSTPFGSCSPAPL